jgi:hypothetical protein
VTIAGNNEAVQAFLSVETDTRFRAGAGNLKPLSFHGGALPFRSNFGSYYAKILDFRRL